MSNFKRLNTKIYEKKGPDVTPDFIYWKQLSVSKLKLSEVCMYVKENVFLASRSS